MYHVSSSTYLNIFTPIPSTVQYPRAAPQRNESSDFGDSQVYALLSDLVSEFILDDVD